MSRGGTLCDISALRGAVDTGFSAACFREGTAHVCRSERGDPCVGCASALAESLWPAGREGMGVGKIGRVFQNQL